MSGDLNQAKGLLPSRRWLLLAVLAASTAWACVGLGVRMLAAAGPAMPFAVPVSLDVNRARVPELMALEGFGRVRAAAVVLHRIRHGQFGSLDELDQVDGIGPGTLTRLRPHLVDPSGH